MKKYVIDIQLGKNTKIDIDHAPNVTKAELEKVLAEIRTFMNGDFEKRFKFRMIGMFYKKDFESFLLKELNCIGKVIHCEWIESNRLCIAFMA